MFQFIHIILKEKMGQCLIQVEKIHVGFVWEFCSFVGIIIVVVVVVVDDVIVVLIVIFIVVVVIVILDLFVEKINNESYFC